MAATAAMGPPLSPREPRRSGRRSIPHAASSSTSKSSKSTSPGPENTNGGPKTSGGRGKRVKDETEETTLVHSVPQAKKGKRKSKKEEKQVVQVLVEETAREQAAEDVEEEESGPTRCVCGTGAAAGATDDDEDAFSFWIQCETCKVWQHGQCVGYPQEDDAPDHYHCEECRPDLHVELLKRLKRAQATSVPLTSRSSRSHSPSHAAAMVQSLPLEKAPKRRNTMNSRETAYHDDLMRKVSDGKLHGEAFGEGTSIAASSVHPDEELDVETVALRRKRKRSETAPAPDTAYSKHSRSESSTSDRPIASTIAAEHQLPVKETVETPELEPSPVTAPPTTQKSGSRGGKRGSKKEGSGDGKRHPNQYTYRRQAQSRGTMNQTQNGMIQNPTASPASHEHSTRRNPQTARPHAMPPPQPLLTSWNLPDYLAHLSQLLPSETPAPLDVPGIGEERGVKVKWPGKRMSVADMGKRVRSLMEWVGREQANHSERTRRKEAIQSAIISPSGTAVNGQPPTDEMEVDVEIDVKNILLVQEGAQVAATPRQITDKALLGTTSSPTGELNTSISIPVSKPQLASEKITSQMMEELMLDLIGFQEKFGSQTKAKELLSF